VAGQLKKFAKKNSSGYRIAFQKRAIQNFRLPVSPLAIDKTATKNQAKIQLKHVLTGDRESGCMSTTKHLAKLAHTVLFFPEHKCQSQGKD